MIPFQWQNRFAGGFPGQAGFANGMPQGRPFQGGGFMPMGQPFQSAAPPAGPGPVTFPGQATPQGMPFQAGAFPGQGGPFAGQPGPFQAPPQIPPQAQGGGLMAGLMQPGAVGAMPMGVPPWLRR